MRRLCLRRRNLRRKLSREPRLAVNRGHYFTDKYEGITIRASVTAATIGLRSRSREEKNSELRSAMSEKGLADAKKVRAKANSEVPLSSDLNDALMFTG